MSIRQPYKDSNIVSRSFRLLSDGLKDPEKFLDRTDYDLKTNFFSTAVGDNLFVNPLPGFGENTDPAPKSPVENNLGELGRYYKRIHQNNALSVSFTAGVPEFTGMLTFLLNMFDYGSSIIATKGRSPSWAFYIAKAAASVAFWPAQILSTSFNFLHYLSNTPANKWYYCKDAMSQYFAGSQGIFNDLMVSAGYSLTVLPDKMFEQNGIKENGRAHGGFKGYEGTGDQGRRANISFLNTLFPDAINADGTIDIMTICTRGARKYRYFAKRVSELDGGFSGIANVDQKDRVIQKMAEDLAKDGSFRNGRGGIKSIKLSDYVNMEAETVAKMRDMDEIAYPETYSSYLNAEVGSSVRPPDGSRDGDPDSFIRSLGDKINTEMGGESGSFGIDNNQGTGSATSNDDFFSSEATPDLQGTVPVRQRTAAPSQESWLSKVFSLTTAAFNGGLDAVTFRMEGGATSATDSFSNTTTQSSIAEKFNGTIQAVQDFRFSTQGGRTGIEFIDSLVGTMKEAAMGLAAGTVVGNIPLALLGNSKVIIPEHWADSSTNLHTETFTFFFEAPYAHPYSIATNVFLPISLLLPYVIPISTGGATYTSPFLVKVFSRGKSIIRNGIVKDAQFDFGTGPLGWTMDMKPRNCRVTITVADLEPIMAMPINRVTNLLDLVDLNGQAARYLGDIGKYNDWISRVTGVDYLDTVLRYNDLNRRLTRFTTDVKSIYSPANIARVVSDSIVGDIGHLFNRQIPR